MLGSSLHGILQQVYCSELPFPSLRYLPNPEIEPLSLTCPALAGRFFTTSATWVAIDPYKTPKNILLKLWSESFLLRQNQKTVFISFVQETIIMIFIRQGNVGEYSQKFLLLICTYADLF